MIIGVFGISGVGKTKICTDIQKNLKGIFRISASEVIRQYGYSTEFTDLNPDNVSSNQLALINGVNQLRSSKKNYLLELHNVIDTPEGVQEIDELVFQKLDLTKAAFLYRPAQQILTQRQHDLIRKRECVSKGKISIMQQRSLDLFTSTFSSLNIPYEIIEKNHFENLSHFLIK